MFGPQVATPSSGGGLGLSLDPVAPQAVAMQVPALIATIRLWINAIYPNVGLGMVLLFTHVIGDVLVGAAATVWSKLSFAAGRKAVWKPSQEIKIKRQDEDQTVDNSCDREAQCPVCPVWMASALQGKNALISAQLSTVLCPAFDRGVDTCRWP